jgi:hypothetical protein
MSDLSKAVDLVRQARMDSWQRMAKDLPDHHVLAVEMFRVDRNTTVSIFTLVRKGRVVQEVLQGDGRGLGVKPVVPHVEQLVPINLGRQFHIDALLVPPPPAVAVAGAVAAATAAAVTAAATSDSSGGSAYAIAYGEPPPKEPPKPGIVAVGGTGMQNAFDTGEIVTADPPLT